MMWPRFMLSTCGQACGALLENSLQITCLYALEPLYRIVYAGSGLSELR